jgi:transposase
VGAVMKPQEIEDEEHEQILERVAAVDVAKASGMVCTRVPDTARPGKRQTLVWQVDATTNAVLELADHLVSERIEKVTLESTSDYCRIWFYLLEVAGLEVQLVRAQDLRRAPGRPKTDKIDCVWQAKCTEKGLLRPSFVPSAESRVLRDYTRMRIDLTRERTRYYSRLEKLLEDALIKVSAVASSIDTLSVRDMVEALIAGERDPAVLAGLARGRMKVKHDKLVQALTGRFDADHGELARMLLDQIDTLTAQIATLTTRIEELIAAIPEAQGADPDGSTGPGAGLAPGSPLLPAVDRLDEITGIGRDAAQVIIAEIGLRMHAFPTPVTWCRGPGSARRPCSPAAAAARRPPARAILTSKESWARPSPQPPAPTPSSASGTGTWPDGAASLKPSSPSPAPSSSSCGTCYQTAAPATTTSAATTTPVTSTSTARPATTSGSSKPSDTPSRSRLPHKHTSAPARVRCRAKAQVIFRLDRPRWGGTRRDAADSDRSRAQVSETGSSPRSYRDVGRGVITQRRRDHFRPARRTRSSCPWRVINHGQKRSRAAKLADQTP